MIRDAALDAKTTVEVQAPAKINLTLHITGQRSDGYHLLDSLVVFAPEAVDRLTLTRSTQTSVRVTGPFATGVPEDARNLCWRAAELYGCPVSIDLEKNLPHAAGIGSGSSDAAAVLRGLETLYDAAFDGDASILGADVPVCQAGHAQIMTGIGDRLQPTQVPPLHAVLVNPGLTVPTGPVFAALQQKTNPAMAPRGPHFNAWLQAQRNDLQAPALSVAPGIAEVLRALDNTRGIWLARMSGSGATCFGLYDSSEAAKAAASTLQQTHPSWWVVASALI